MAYNNMHEVQFRDALNQATDAEVTEARDYWQRRADAHSAYDYGQRYADMCRAELKTREDATTGRAGATYRLSAVEAAILPDNYIQDHVVPELVEAALAAGADRRSLATHVEEDPKAGGWTIRVTGLVRA